MDYKELVALARKAGKEWLYSDEYHQAGALCKMAADAIETLLAERDAAVEDLWKRPHSSTCKHGEHCDYISAITGFPDCYSCDEWEWRGPQKGDGHGG